MRKEKSANKSPIDKIKIVNDFLATPKKLVSKKEMVRVTLMLSKESVDYFKQEAEKQKARYQVMIRSLLDQYTNHCNKRRSS